MSAAYTKSVYVARHILPVLALLVVAALAAWPFLQKKTDAVLAQVPQNKMVPAAPEPALTVIKPEFKGVDSKQRPYHIIAERIEQGLDTTQPIMLTNPVATLTLSANNMLKLVAATAVFDRSQNTLALAGQVNLQNSQGYTITTNTLNVNLNNKTASSQNAVMATGPAGTLTGAGFELTQDAQLLKVFGPAKLILQKLDKK